MTNAFCKHLWQQFDITPFVGVVPTTLNLRSADLGVFFLIIFAHRKFDMIGKSDFYVMEVNVSQTAAMTTPTDIRSGQDIEIMWWESILPIYWNKPSQNTLYTSNTSITREFPRRERLFVCIYTVNVCIYMHLHTFTCIYIAFIL